MDRTEYVLAVLSTADGQLFTPVQVQKLFFLLDRKVPHLINGPRFNFEPYDYGPFDKAVYSDLRSLAGRGDVAIDSVPNSLIRKYRPTPSGLERGQNLLKQLPEDGVAYIRKLSGWVRSQPFAALVAWVYKAFPEMKEHSVFKD